LKEIRTRREKASRVGIEAERMYSRGRFLHSSHGKSLHVSHVGLDKVGLEGLGGHGGVLVDSGKVSGGEVDRGTRGLRGGVGSRGGLVLLGGGGGSVKLEEGHCECVWC
jgi:hypothetical protein